MNNEDLSKNSSRSTLGAGVYYSDPRLKMTWAGRLIVRVVGWVSYFFLLIATITLLASGVKDTQVRWMFYLGLALALFFGDYILHSRDGDNPLSELPNRGRVNLAQFLKPSTYSVVERSFDKSVIRRSDFLLEVINQLVASENIKQGLLRMDLSPKELEQKVGDFLRESAQKIKGADEREADLQSLVKGAFDRALAVGHKFIEPSDLFSALVSTKDEYLSRLFTLFAIDKSDLDKALIFADKSSRVRSFPSTVSGFIPGISKTIRHRIMNRAWTSRPTPTLDKYSVDLTDLARQERVGFLIGHKNEYDLLEDTLARPINPNALLVGDEGVGKETLVSHLAFNISKDKVPAPLFDKRLVLLQISEMVAGAAQEELQARLKKIVDEIMIAGNVILYIPEFHNLVKTSGTAYISAADALVPIIKNSVFPVIGATYPREFKNEVEARSDLLGLFEVIRINEITKDEAEEILVYESLILEKEAKVVISFGAIKKAVYLAKKYLTNKFLPSSGDELLKSAISLAKRKGDRVLTADVVVEATEMKVNVPIHEAGEAEAKQLLKMEEIIHKRLVDQDEAVKAVSDVLREYRSGLTKPGRPIASFLFVGPTGVGKTELSKILTEIMFGSKDASVRFDMTEYQDKQSFYRFIGSPDGKITGALTEAIVKKPYSSILLDEFEKAYPDILDLFLQVFDDGRLTDNLGRTVDFQNTIIIATSNAHSDIINEALRSGQTMAQISEYLRQKLTDVFKPELLNRFSKVVIFNNLSADDVKKVAAFNLSDFAKLVSEQGIFLSFAPEAVEQVAKLGYDPAYGARPLQRVIAERLRAPLAEKILSKEVARGNKVEVGFDGSSFTFRARA